ncbi:MAG: proton-conducting transporter membrane subunit [Spirochaetales bacterium]
MGIFLLLSSFSLLLLGFVLILLFRNTKILSHLLALVSILFSLGIIFASLWIFLQADVEEFYREWSIPYASFYLRIDSLNAVFLLLLGLVGGVTSLYSYGYISGTANSRALYWLGFLFLQGSMALVCTAYNGILFFLSWELMSLSSFFLVMYEYDKPKVRRAAWIYLIATHAGSACLLYLFALLGNHQIWDFDSFQFSSVGAWSIVTLTFLGFGIKAGFMPLHVWLPEAHPAAPSPISALMSGVLIKTGIYGILRILALAEGSFPPFSAFIYLGFGALSGIFGVLFALNKKDMKEILAYSSIENIGIIGLGIGMGMYGTTHSNGIVGILGFMAALFHSLNHGLIKTSLFLGSGTVLHATHTKNIEEMGGVGKILPKTGLYFGLSSMALSGLPPFNGFIGEFLLFLSGLALCIQTPSLSNILLIGGLFATLAIISGGALACFTRLFGIIFLGEPRTEIIRKSSLKEPLALYLPGYILAACNLLIGLGSLGIAPLMFAGALSIVPPIEGEYGFETVQLLKQTLLPLGILGAFLLGLSFIMYSLRNLMLKTQRIASSLTWDCGYLEPSPRMQYTGTSFSQPIWALSRGILRPVEQVDIEGKLFPKKATYHFSLPDIFQRLFFNPLYKSLLSFSRKLYWLQEGRNQVYILYIAITLLGLLLLVTGRFI